MSILGRQHQSPALADECLFRTPRKRLTIDMRSEVSTMETGASATISFGSE
jgi:hypothetical protein